MKGSSLFGWIGLVLSVPAAAADLKDVEGRYVRDLSSAPLPALQVQPRLVILREVRVTDRRPPEERTSLQRESGYLRPESEWISSNPTLEFNALIHKAFQESGLLSDTPSSEALVLEIDLLHLYGITRVGPGLFGAYGFADAEVRLQNPKGALLAVRRVTGYCAPSAKEVEAQPEYYSVGMGNSLTAAAAKAAGQLAHNIIRAVEPTLDRYTAKTAPDIEQSPTFFLARRASEGPYLEVATVDFDTGQVKGSVIRPLWMEPYSGLQEWVVDPFFGGAVRLTPEQYQRLFSRLGQRYDVRYVNNVRVAHFFGKRAGAAASPPAANSNHPPSATTVPPPAASP